MKATLPRVTSRKVTKARKLEGRLLQLMNLRKDMSYMELMRVHRLLRGIPVATERTTEDTAVAAIAP